MADFTQASIEVGYFTDLWGPYKFSLPIASSESANDGVIPYDDTIASATVRAFVGDVRRSSVLADETEISDDLIDPGYDPVSGDDYVKVKFQHPGEDYIGEKATLIFEVTLTSGGKKAFYFQYVRIR